MKKISALLLPALLWPLLLSAQNFNLELRSKMAFPGTGLGNVWGYAAGGREYALVAGSTGLNIVEVTDPDHPVLIKTVPGFCNEVKTYAHYAYAVNGGGILIVDLQQLPDTSLAYHTYTGDGLIAGTLGYIHTLHIDTTKGFLYAHGVYASVNNALLPAAAIVFDLKQQADAPVYAGYVPKYEGYGSDHDGYADNDTLYAAMLYEGIFAIYDMRDKAHPRLLGTQTTPSKFTHNTWLSEDRRTLFTTDERGGAYVAAFDISDPSDIRFLDKIRDNPDSALSIPHNTCVIGNYLVTAWYTAGVTIVDATRPENLVEVGRYDTYPDADGGFNGCWGAYPYLPSGIILASNMTHYKINDGALYILSPSYKRAAYVEGHVYDAVTGNPLAGAEVWFKNHPEVDHELSSPSGAYKTGFRQSGATALLAGKFGYYTKEISVNLVSGEDVSVDFYLSPIPSTTVKGVVLRAGDLTPLPNAHVLIRNDKFRKETQTDGNGAFAFEKVPIGVQYTLIAGAWGYRYGVLVDQLVVPTSHKNVVFQLPKGYADEFVFDYGWTFDGTSLSGQWERTKPEQRTGFPYLDDLEDQCYVTGNGEQPFSQNHVKNGTMILSSPVFDLSGYKKPLLQFALYFSEYTENPDTLHERLWLTMSNGTGEKTIAEMPSGTGSWIFYSDSTFADPATLPLTNTMQVRVYAFDDPDIPSTLYEAAFDAFSIEDRNTSGTAVSRAANVWLELAPNPFRGQATLQYRLPEAGFSLKLSDVSGSVREIRKLENGSGALELGAGLASGIYFIRLEKEGQVAPVLKLVKVE